MGTTGKLVTMTAVAAWGYSPLASEGMEETHTPHRNVRVPGVRWNPFGMAVGARNRSSWLNDFISWVIDDPQLWHDARTIAARRGDDLGEVVLKALRAYVQRHRRLLAEHADEPPAS